MDKSLLRPKKVEWSNKKGDKFTYIKIDNIFYNKYINGEFRLKVSAGFVNPHMAFNGLNGEQFFLDYIKAFDKACFNEELESLLSEDKNE